MEVILKTKHFKEATRYEDREGCPLFVALKEEYPSENISVGPILARIGEAFYKIKGATINFENPPECEAYSGLKGKDIDALIVKAKTGEEVEDVVVELISD